MDAVLPVDRATIDPGETGFKHPDEACCRLLLDACRRGGDRPIDLSSHGWLLDTDARRRFLAAAVRHHVPGLALSRLAPRVATDSEWQAVRQEWATHLRYRSRRSAVFELKRSRALVVLREAGILPVVLKGAALRSTVYPDPVERELEDLDLLVRGSEVERAATILGREGYLAPHSRSVVEAYRRHHFHLHLRHADGHVIEVHWGLSLPGSPFRLGAEEIQQEAVEAVSADGVAMWIPSPHHLVLQIVLQNLQEGFSRLGRLVDVDRIATMSERFPWGRLVDAARAGGLAPATALSLQLARRLLGTPVPSEVLRALWPTPAARFHLAIMGPEESLLCQSFSGAYAPAKLFELWLVEGTAGRVRQLVRQLGEVPLSTMARGAGPGAVERVLRLGKVGGAQLLAYAVAVGRRIKRKGEGPFEFWSSPRARMVGE